jgi:hypothetical protein
MKAERRVLRQRLHEFYAPTDVRCDREHEVDGDPSNSPGIFDLPTTHRRPALAQGQPS